MANTFKFGNKNWAWKEGSVLAYNDENNNFKPLPFDFTRSSSATRVNKDGLIEVVGSDEPRVDYLNNADGHLLLEPSRTNVYVYSEDFSQSTWTKASLTATLTSDIAPDGSTDSVYNIAGTNANLYTGGTTGVEHTISFYIKSNGQGKDKFKLRLGNNTSEEFTATNEWIRYSFTSTPTTTVFGITTSSSPNNELDLLIWGAQSEQASYATSYIPTSGSSVTRAADSCLDSGNSSIFNNSEGVLYAEISALSNTADASKYISISDETYNNRASILFSSGSTNQIRTFLRVSGVAQIDASNNVTDVTDFNKVAFSYKENDFKVYINGSLVTSDTSGSVWSAGTIAKLSFSEINTSAGLFNGKCKDIKVYNTALTDSELIALTS